MQIVGSQFVVQTDYALAQRVQDNKFVESGLGNWVLVNLGYHHHKFKDSFDETLKQMEKDPQFEKLSFYIRRSFLCVILNKLLLSLIVGS